MSQTPDELCDAISAFIEDSYRLLEQDQIVDLSGMDSRIATLCRDVLALSDEARAKYTKRLEELFEKLNRLGDEIKNRRDAVAEELRSLAVHRKASVAYASINNIDGKGAPKADDEEGEN